MKSNQKILFITIGTILLAFLYAIDYKFFDLIFKKESLDMFFLVLVTAYIIMVSIFFAESGGEIFIREIPGIKAMEEAIGRSTEMGKPVLFVPGIQDFDEVETIAGVNILGNASEIDITSTGAIDINSAAFTLDGSTVSLDATDSTNLTMTANAYATKTMTISATNSNASNVSNIVGSPTSINRSGSFCNTDATT